MRICYVLNSGYLGGVEQHVLDLVVGMVYKGNQVFVVCPWGDMVPRYFQEGARVRVDAPKLDIDPFYIFRLAQFLRRNKIDLLHAHQLKTSANSLLAVTLNNFLYRVFSLGSRVVVVTHVHTPLSRWQVPEWKKAINVFGYHYEVNWFADKEIALTESVKKVKMGEGIKEEKLVVIPNGIKLSKFKSQNSKLKNRTESFGQNEILRIGTLSRLTVEKNVATLVAAVGILETLSNLGTRTTYDGNGTLQERRYSDKDGEVAKFTSRSREGRNSEQLLANKEYRILIAGDGTLRKDLEQQALELGIAGQVDFLGFIDEKKKPGYLHSLDIFVMPSLAEGFGIALIEAMACGCACVVSDLPVLEDVAGGSVLYFDPNDPRYLAMTLEKLLVDQDLRGDLSQKAKKRAERLYSMHQFVENYDILYKCLSR